MSYLSRVAARAAGGAEAAPMRASIASSSPLVAHDQRLNIPEFAAATAASVFAPEPAEGAGSGPFFRLLPERTRIEQEVIVTETFREPSPAAPTPVVARAAPVSTSAASKPQTLAPSTAEVTAAPPPPSSPVAPSDGPQPAEKKQRPERTRRSQYVDEHPDPIERAFADANAWLRTPASERRARPQLEAKPAAPAAFREPSARGAPALNRSLERPSLTIGAINVEVVAPPALPGVATAKAIMRHEPSRGRSSGAPFGARPGFGWRQR